MPDPTEAPAPPASQVPALDAPSPQVEPQFLRPVRAPAARAPTSRPAVHGPPLDVDATLVDAITRIVTGMLQQHVSDSVTAAVRALAPRLVVSLGPERGEGDAQVRARPARAGRRDDPASASGDV